MTPAGPHVRLNAASSKSQSFPMRASPISSTTSLTRIPAAAPGPPGHTSVTIAPARSAGRPSFFRIEPVTGPASMPSVPAQRVASGEGAAGGGDEPAQRTARVAPTIASAPPSDAATRVDFMSPPAASGNRD